jgi:hypothetical protein
MTAAVAHLLEMPAKMRYERDLYVRLHRTLYPNFGRFAGVAEILSVILSAGTALSSRTPLTTAAAGCLAASHAIFWTLVSPANRTMASWPITAIPPDWRRWRDRWEYAHAARAILQLAAMGALISACERRYPAPDVPARAEAETAMCTA